MKKLTLFVCILVLAAALSPPQTSAMSAQKTLDEAQITSTAATEASQAVSNNSMEVAMAQSEQVVNMANQMANNPVSCINANLAAPVGKNAESNMVPMKTLINIVGFICRMEEIVGCVDPLLC